jgi:ribosomal protein S18 acetylase RimI-like enzyme
MLSSIERPVLAEYSDLNTVAEDLSAAFAKYPLCHWILGKKNNEKTRLKLFQVLVRDIGYTLGTIYRPTMGGAAAIWIPSENLDAISSCKNLRMMTSLLTTTGIAGFSRLLAMNKAMDRHHPKIEKHSYLFLIGVHPQIQSRGIGSCLLRTGLERVDTQGCSAFLETSAESAISLYRRFRFEISEIYDVCQGAPRTWAMWRQSNAVADK